LPFISYQPQNLKGVISMKQTNIIKQIIGIDVSKDSIDLRFGSTDITQEETISKTAKFKNTTTGFDKLIEWKDKKIISKNIPLFFVMETTGVYYENLAYYLFEKGYNVTVVLANKISNYAKTLETKSKTDPIDAATITRFGLERKLKLWNPPSITMKSIKSLCREYHSTKDNITEIKNQIHALKTSYKADSKSIKRKTKQIKLLEQQTKEIITQIKTIIAKEENLSKRIKKIITAKGLGFITVVSVIAETNGFELVNNQKQLTSYAGFDVVLNNSGNRKGKTSISKKGNKYLRKAVFMPALSAIQHNQKMKELYKRLVQKGKNKKLALIAVARKLLLLIYTLWKNDTVYIPNYKSQ
jgi:transposase